MFENFDLMHTIERELYHIFWGPGLFVVCLIGFLLLEKHWRHFPALRGWWQLIFPAIPAYCVILARETFDVFRGGAVLKSVIDWGVWTVVLGLCVWGSMAILPVLVQIRKEIDEDKERRSMNL